MTPRAATPDDAPWLARLNYQLIHDEGHRNAMTIEELGERMYRWLAVDGYQAIVFEEGDQVMAYALFRETATEVYLRQFFVTRDLRRRGIGRQAMRTLFGLWPKDKRLTVSVLAANKPGVAFWKALGYTDYDLTLEIMPRRTNA